MGQTSDQAAVTPAPQPALRPDWRMLCVALLGLVVAATVFHPAFSVIESLTHASKQGQAETNAAAQHRNILSAAMVLRTLGVGASIGLLATVLGLPAAWWIGTHPAHPSRLNTASWLAGLGAAPMLLPPYLAYAGWSIARGPGSWLGDWLAQPGRERLSLHADTALAIGGLSLWAWPCATVVLAVWVRRLSGDLLDSLRLECGLISRVRQIARMLVPGLLASIGLITLITTGSAVPLHLAQVQTLAISLWKLMAETGDMRTVWIGSIPLILVAAAGAFIAVRVALRTDRSESHEDLYGSSRRRFTRFLTIAVWTASVLVPAWLFTTKLTGWDQLIGYWRAEHAAAVRSGIIAALVGIACALCMVLAWAGAANHGGRAVRRATAILTGLLCVSGLVPGVLIGAAVNASWAGGEFGSLGSIAWNTPIPTLCAHLARFGFIAALAGLWMASREPRERTWQRSLDGATGPRGWIATVLVPDFLFLLGIGLICALLSLHEIESSVIVQPPAAASLAQQVLDDLHYARDGRVAAAALGLILAGVVFASLAGRLIGHATRRAGST